MKRTIPFLMLALFCRGSFAQPYQSLFGDSATLWTITKIGIDWYYTDSLIVLQDTNINSNIYKKILYRSPHPNFDNVFGFLREDTSIGRAWYLSPYDTIERMIMDLNLSVGDSFYFSGDASPVYGTHYVDSIYYSSGRKYVQFSITVSWQSSEQLSFIEGIGTNAGIDYHTPFFFYTYPYLLCAFKDDQKIYKSLYYDSLCYVEGGGGIANENKSKIQIKIFPNPFRTSTTLVIANEVKQSQPFTFVMYDLLGREVKKIKMQNSQCKIEKGNLPSGMYIYQLKNEKEIFARGKLIIQ